MSKEDEDLAEESPFEGKLQREAFVAGHKEGRKPNGQERDQHPRKFGNQKSTIECWKVGWDRGRAELRIENARKADPNHPSRTIAESQSRLPGTATRVVADGPSQVRGEGQHPNTYWPDGVPMPKAYQKRPLVPCPKCRRLLLDDLGQAVVCKCTANGKAYLECRSCGNRFELAVE